MAMRRSAAANRSSARSSASGDCRIRAIFSKSDGREPWWFESGHDWNDGAAYPHGIETRFRDAGLAPIFGDLDGFVDAAQELQYRALKYQIETLRWEQPDLRLRHHRAQ